MTLRSVAFLSAAAIMVVLTACRPSQPLGEPADPLPAIPVYEITPTRDSVMLAIRPAPNRDPLGALGASRRVTLTASDADARTLLLWLAQEAGVNLVVSPDVRARVSVNFADVPAVDAMRAIMLQAGLSVLSAASGVPWPPVIFHHAPVNVNEASAAAIVARFGVSDEMVKWILESRTRP
jgi:hypothetical protein